MLLAGDNGKFSPNQLQVILLQPPQGSVVGDMVYMKGSQPASSYPEKIDPNDWFKIVDQLSVIGTVWKWFNMHTYAYSRRQCDVFECGFGDW